MIFQTHRSRRWSLITRICLISGFTLSLAACDKCSRTEDSESSTSEDSEQKEVDVETEAQQLEGEAVVADTEGTLVKREDVAAAIANVKTKGALETIVDNPGSGATASSGQRVHVHYTGYLTDGSKFDSSRDRQQPFDFTLGQGQVIAGWDQGVSGMKIGERRVLVIPSEMGYGSRGAGSVIPPDSILVFDVELLEVK